MEKTPVYWKDGRQYGVTSGLFRSRWWNYFERGCSYAEGWYWEAAEADFKKALQQRDEDRRRARTYGVLNFIDYFPHRELGICYYRQGRYPEAIHELERSIHDTPSAKAYYFINKARRGWLLQEGLDSEMPVLVIDTPRPGEITNAFEERICGLAMDDYFISRIQVGETEVPLDVSQKELTFCQEVALEHGSNTIPLVVEDLVGRKTQEAVIIMVDREGPQLSLEDLTYHNLRAGRKIILKGFADDEHAIERLSFNGIEVPIPEDQRTSFSFTQVLLSKPEENKVSFVAEDVAGNRNEGVIRLVSPPPGQSLAVSSDPLYGLTRVACFFGNAIAAYDTVMLPQLGKSMLPSLVYETDFMPSVLARDMVPWGISAASNLYEGDGPVLRFKDLKDHQKTYFDTIYLEGNIQGPAPIQRLTLNGEPILKRQGRNLFFGIFWKLHPGDNEMVFLAEDMRGRRLERRIHIQYVVPKVWRMESRLKVFVVPFQPVRCENTIREYVSEHFLFSLVEQKRFHIVNREELDRILLEQRLNQSELADPETAVKLGRIARAEEALVGSVYEGRQSIEIFSQMIDTETGEVVLENDVFHEDKSPERLREITAGLALKFKNAMPLIQGNILKIEKAYLYADIGQEEKIRKGMRIVVFREGTEIEDPESGKCVGFDTEELGEAVIKHVEDQHSTGEFLRPEICKKVSLKDRVITK